MFVANFIGCKRFLGRNPLQASCRFIIIWPEKRIAMDVTKIIAAGFVMLLAAGAVTAAGAGGIGQVASNEGETVSDVDVDAAYENETVTLTLVDEGAGENTGIANATVYVQRESHDDEEAYERIGTTNADGAITFDPAAVNESRNITTLEVAFEKGTFNAEVNYRVGPESLSLIEEEYEYEHENEHEEYQEEQENEPGEAYPGSTNTTKQGGQLNVSMADARATANAALTEPPQGDWRLVEADAHEENNYYKFEYTLAGADSPGEAEIRVNGNSGDVVKYEQEHENENENEQEHE